MGHKTLEMTLRYTHPSGHNLADAINLLDKKDTQSAKGYKMGTFEKKGLRVIS